MFYTKCINVIIDSTGPYTSYDFKKMLYFFSLKINFGLANSEDPDEMPHYAGFHLGPQCLSKYLMVVSGPQRFTFMFGCAMTISSKVGNI